MTEIACGWRSSETGSVECPSSVPPSKRGILTFHWPAGMRVMRLSRKSTVVPSVSSHVVCMNKLDESCKNDWCVIVSTPSVTYRIPRRTVHARPQPPAPRGGLRVRGVRGHTGSEPDSAASESLQCSEPTAEPPGKGRPRGREAGRGLASG